MKTVYVSIGNSDDKLTQFRWSCFHAQVDKAVTDLAKYEGVHVHGRWVSPTNEAWQNACWAFSIADELADQELEFRAQLARLGRSFEQDSVAYAVAPVTEFL